MVEGRSRKAPTIASSSPQMRLTSLLLIPASMPRAAHEIVDLAGADTVDVRLHHDRPQGAVDPPARLEQQGRNDALPELGDVQLDIARLGAEQPGPAPVAVRRALVGPLVAAGADHRGGLGLDELLGDQASSPRA